MQSLLNAVPGRIKDEISSLRQRWQLVSVQYSFDLTGRMWLVNSVSKNIKGGLCFHAIDHRYRVCGGGDAI